MSDTVTLTISTPVFIHLGIPDQFLLATEAFFDDAIICSDSRLVRQWDVTDPRNDVS